MAPEQLRAIATNNYSVTARFARACLVVRELEVASHESISPYTNEAIAEKTQLKSTEANFLATAVTWGALHYLAQERAHSHPLAA